MLSGAYPKMVTNIVPLPHYIQHVQRKFGADTHNAGGSIRRVPLHQQVDGEDRPAFFFINIKSVIGKLPAINITSFHTFFTRPSASFTNSSIGLFICWPLINGMAQKEQVRLQPSGNFHVRRNAAGWRVTFHLLVQIYNLLRTVFKISGSSIVPK